VRSSSHSSSSKATSLPTGHENGSVSSAPAVTGHGMQSRLHATATQTRAETVAVTAVSLAPKRRDARRHAPTLLPNTNRSRSCNGEDALRRLEQERRAHVHLLAQLQQRRRRVAHAGDAQDDSLTAATPATTTEKQNERRRQRRTTTREATTTHAAHQSVHAATQLSPH
jgi:hypothetical protein